MNLNPLLAICLIFVVPLQCTGVDAEVMCVDSSPMASPKMLTSIYYPVMVTAAQCQCVLIPGQTNEELDLHVELRRSDRTVDCSRTQMTIIHRNLSNVICPTLDDDDGGQLESGGDKKKTSVMTISLSLTKDDRPAITLWNSQLEFINVQVILTSEHPVPYNIVCTHLDGSLYWPYEDHGLGFDDGIASGIKVAIVVLFFILAVALSAAIRLIVRLRMRRAQYESKMQQARLKRICRLKQAMAFDNLGFSSSTINHNSSGSSIIQYSGKPSHNGNLRDSVTVESTSRSTLASAGIASRTLTGHGCIWPLEEDERRPRRPMVNTSTHTYTPDIMSAGVGPIRTSKPVKVHYADDASVSTAGCRREKPLPKYYHQAPSTSSQTVAIGGHSTCRNSFPDALAPHLIGSGEEQHGQAPYLSDASVALVHQRERGKSWQKNSRTASRKLRTDNNGHHHQKMFDKDELLSITTNTTREKSIIIITPPAQPVFDDTSSAEGVVHLSMTSNDRMPRESAI